MPIQNPLINFENQWVALTPDRRRVVASGKNYSEVAKKLKKMRKEDVILTYVPPFDGFIAPYSLG